MMGAARLAAALLALLAAATSGEPLLLTPMLDKGDLAGARKAAAVTIDGMDLGYSGYLSVPSASGKNTNNMFFWYQPCSNKCDPSTAPLVQWFQGGPGADSMFGAMAEVGNYYVETPAGPVAERCFSWCRERNCLFVDSPVQTGQSFQTNSTGQFPGLDAVEYTETSEHALEQIYGVLVQFLVMFPELQPAPYWVTGESYGGNYVAWMAKTIVKHNKLPETRIKVNLQGVSVGDPVLGWQVQFGTYATTLHAMGLLMQDERDHVERILSKATNLVTAGDCWGAFNEWNKIWNDDGGGSCKPNCEFLYRRYTGSSATDNLLIGDGAENPYGEWMRRHSGDFHFDGKPGPSQMDEGGSVYLTLVKSGDFCQNSAFIYLKELFVEAGLNVNIYSSNVDPLLGPPTTEAGIGLGLDAAGLREAFYERPKTIFWTSPSESNPAGYSRCLPADGGRGNRFCYTIIRNAGHTTPSYSPAFAYDMTLRFLGGKPFDRSWYDAALPACAACGGAPPFAGGALPQCACPAPAPPPVPGPGSHQEASFTFAAPEPTHI